MIPFEVAFSHYSNVSLMCSPPFPSHLPFLFPSLNLPSFNVCCIKVQKCNSSPHKYIILYSFLLRIICISSRMKFKATLVIVLSLESCIAFSDDFECHSNTFQCHKGVKASSRWVFWPRCNILVIPSPGSCLPMEILARPLPSLISSFYRCVWCKFPRAVQSHLCHILIPRRVVRVSRGS